MARLEQNSTREKRSRGMEWTTSPLYPIDSLKQIDGNKFSNGLPWLIKPEFPQTALNPVK